jgi:hypothetical protein
MPPSKAPATSVATFLSSLTVERRKDLERVRNVVRKHLPKGYEEAVSKNMLVYQVPFERYSDTYNGQPLWYAALASQKSGLSLHLMPVYGDPASAERLKNGFKVAGKKLDMGKACIRFQKADDLALDAIAQVVASVSVDRWIQIAQAARRR